MPSRAPRPPSNLCSPSSHLSHLVGDRARAEGEHFYASALARMHICCAPPHLCTLARFHTRRFGLVSANPAKGESSAELVSSLGGAVPGRFVGVVEVVDQRPRRDLGRSTPEWKRNSLRGARCWKGGGVSSLDPLSTTAFHIVLIREVTETTAAYVRSFIRTSFILSWCASLSIQRLLVSGFGKLVVDHLRTMDQYSRKQDTVETNCQPPEGPLRCTNNCGFFGSAVTLGMCSKCYRDFVLTQANASSTKPAESAVAVSAMQEPVLAQRPGAETAEIESAHVLPVGQPEASVGSSSSGQDPSRPKPNRCFSCKKRVGLTGFECRCGNLFCSSHRYSDKHSCPFDYKMAGRDAIAKANPVVKADKVNKI